MMAGASSLLHPLREPAMRAFVDDHGSKLELFTGVGRFSVVNG